MKFLIQTQMDDGLLLYNVVTSEMVLLDGSERDAFMNLPDHYSKELDELIARHYAVPVSFDENRSVRELRALLRKLEAPKRVSGFTILPTTECNARCYYCFESDFNHCTMTEEIANDVINYIVEKGKGEPVEITWFGGEPLVAVKRISQICAGLKDKNVQFKSTMVSNAYLFDTELIQTAKNDWHLTGVQVTLDGTEAVYNETKAYVNPKCNPYVRVLHNIGLLLDSDIIVAIRLNVTDTNFTDLSDLIEELAARFGGRKGFAGYSHAVYEGVGFRPLAYSDDNLVDDRTVELDAKLRAKGLMGSHSRLPNLRVVHCMADSDSTRLIYPDGTIGKCENMPSSEGVGDIYHDIVDEKKNAWYKLTEQPTHCNDCCLFPSCFDLVTCPEAGKCTQVKRKWKKDSYTGLMRDTYLKYKHNEHQSNQERSICEDCES